MCSYNLKLNPVFRKRNISDAFLKSCLGELKPCPFCGSGINEVSLGYEDADGYFCNKFSCANCGASFFDYNLIDFRNTPVIAEKLKALGKAFNERADDKIPVSFVHKTHKCDKTQISLKIRSCPFCGSLEVHVCELEFHDALCFGCGNCSQEVVFSNQLLDCASVLRMIEKWNKRETGLNSS